MILNFLSLWAHRQLFRLDPHLNGSKAILAFFPTFCSVRYQPAFSKRTPECKPDRLNFEVEFVMKICHMDANVWFLGKRDRMNEDGHDIVFKAKVNIIENTKVSQIQ